MTASNSTLEPTTTALPSAQAGPLRLRFVGTQRDGQVVRINSDQCSIGSAAEATFRLICKGIEGIHCLIQRAPQGMTVRCVSSGTLLNGKPFQDAPLGVGDRLTIGPVELEVLPFESPALDAEPNTSAGESAELAEVLARLETEKNQWRSEQAQQQQQLAQAQQQLEEHRSSLDSERQRLAESQQVSEDLQSELNELRQQLNAFHTTDEEAEAAQAAHEETQRQLAKAQTEQDTLQKELERTQSELRDAQAQLAAGQEALQAAEAALRAAEQITTDNTEPQADVSDLQAQNEQLQQSLSASAAELTKLVEERDGWHGERDAYEQEVSSLRAQMAEASGQDTADVRDELARIQSQLEDAQAQKHSEETARRELESSYQQLESQLETLREQGSQQAALEAELATLRSQYEQATLELETLRETPPPSPHHDATVPMEAGSADVLDRLRAEVGGATMTEPLDLPSDDAAPPVDELDEDAASYQELKSAEDLTFSEPNEAAPVDTAAILAKFGHSVDDDDMDPLSPEDAVTQPTFQESATIPTPPGSLGGANGEDEDIEDYMAELMQRVGGSSDDAPAGAVEEPSATIATPTQMPTQAQPVEPPKESAPLNAAEFVPRAVAPEASSNLQALRAVANTSARTAIDKHQRRSSDRRALLSLFIAVAAGVVGVAMGWFAPQLQSLPALISGVMFVIAAVAGTRAAVLARKAKTTDSGGPSPSQFTALPSPESPSSKTK